MAGGQEEAGVNTTFCKIDQMVQIGSNLQRMLAS